MAFSVSVLKKTVFGDMRVHVISMVADAAEGVVATGLNNVVGYTISPGSFTSAPKIYMNKGSTSTAINGTLGCSGFVSGDFGYITAYGN